MNLVLAPESHAIFVIFLKLSEDWFALYLCVVVCIEAYE